MNVVGGIKWMSEIMKNPFFSFWILFLTLSFFFLVHCGEGEPQGEGSFFNVAMAASQREIQAASQAASQGAGASQRETQAASQVASQRAGASQRETHQMWQRKAQKIKSLLRRSSIPKKNLSIYIQGIQNPHHLFEINSHQQRTPASLIKLITAGAALYFYPPYHRFQTHLSSPAPLDRDTQTLDGPLFLVGRGDPSFTSESMWNLVNHFYRRSIRKIRGPIIVDDSHFSKSLQIERASRDDPDRAYNASSSALSFNWNAVNVFIRPHEKVGERAYVHLDPLNTYISLKGSITTVPSSQSKNIHVSRKISSRGISSIVVRGRIPQNAGEVVVYKSITKPSLWAGHNLKEFLRQRGIIVEGKVLKGKAPANSSLLAMVKGKTVAEIVTAMNKFSNNFISEMLLKKMVTDKVVSNKDLPYKPYKPYKLDKLDKTVSDKSDKDKMAKINQNKEMYPPVLEPLRFFMQEVGIKKNEFQLFDSSGLSNKNKLSAFSLYKLLSYFYRLSPQRHEFISSLPIAGGEGTLLRRFKGLSFSQSLIRAKTGTLKGVVGLAGYAQQEDQKETFIFVLVYNGSGKEYQTQTVFDSISHLLTLIKIN